MQKRYLKPYEVQELLSITPTTEIEWAKTGKLPEPFYVNRRKFYVAEEVYEWVEKSKEGVKYVQ